MQSYRDGKLILICDGCFNPIEGGEIGFDTSWAWECKDGHKGHVCTCDCGALFEQAPPLDGRTSPHLPEPEPAAVVLAGDQLPVHEQRRREHNLHVAGSVTPAGNGHR